MLLHALNQLYERLEQDPAYQIAPPGYSLQKIGFCVLLRSDGSLVDIQDLRIQEGKKLAPVQKLVPGQTKPSGAGLNPCFLWDNTKYLLGYDNKATDDNQDKDKLRKRALETWGAFVEKHLSLEQVIAHPDFSAVCRFLKLWQPDRAENFEFLSKMNNYGLFRIQGQQRFVHELPEARAWWASQAKTSTDETEETSKKKNTKDQPVEGLCLVSGERAILARLHKPKIKGVVGGKSEVSLVSFNDDAYRSYGLDKSYNAPVSEEVAFKYGTALNALLDGPMQTKHRQRLGDATVAFWTEKPSLVEDVFAQYFSTTGPSQDTDTNAQDEALRQKLEIFLRALRDGREAFGTLGDDVEQTKFFLLALSPNAARVSVRFFFQSGLGEVLDHLRQHQQDLHIEGGGKDKDAEGKERLIPAWLILAQTARESKEVAPLLSGGLLRAILTGAPYPQALFSGVLRRIRAEREIRFEKASIIKAVLNRNYNKEVSVSLDVNRPDPAYRLGRLFAVLEKTQKDALGQNLNSTIRDRFYSSASATPQTVFPRLLRTYQHHLAKLEGGFRVNREKLMQQVLETMENFPAQLNLEDQGLFAIGYYHQTQDFYRSHKGVDTPETAENN